MNECKIFLFWLIPLFKMVKNIFLVRRMYRHPFLLTPREQWWGSDSHYEINDIISDATPWFTKMHRWNKMTGWQSTYKIGLQESNNGGDAMNDIVSANSNNIFLELSNNMIPLHRPKKWREIPVNTLSVLCLASLISLHWYPQIFYIPGYILFRKVKQTQQPA